MAKAVVSRTCPHCGETKPAACFDKSRRKRCGLATYCKDCRHAKQAGIRRPCRIWTERELAILSDLYPTISTHDIAGRIERNAGAIREKARAIGLKKTVIIAPSGRLCPANRRYHARDGVFAVLTPAAAYVLGYLTADGCLLNPKKANHTPSEFTFTSKDLELIEKVCAVLESDYPIKPYQRKQKTYYRATIGSATAYADLLALGLTPRKSLTIQMPKVPDALFFHFLRGYFDGDGSTGRCKRGGFNIHFASGSRRLLEQINARTDRLAGVHGKIGRYKGRRASYLQLTGPTALFLADRMYVDADDLFLSRKRAVVESYRANRKRFHKPHVRDVPRNGEGCGQCQQGELFS